jgi:ABC-type sugar transport system permease subunit
MTKDIKAKAPKRRRSASLEKRKARGGWLFVLPFVLGFILIYLPIVIDSIKYSFHEIKVLPASQGGGYSLIPVGFKNYSSALLEDPDFVKVLLTGLQSLALDVPIILIFSLFIAVLLNQKMIGRAAFRAIFFIPVILSTGLMETIESTNVLSDYMGEASGINDGSGQSTSAEIVSAMDIEKLLSGMAVGGELVGLVTDTINRIYDIVNRSGVQMLIFLAGLQSISPAIYESVQIDGATAWETFWKITFPMITPMILVNAVYTIIDSFTTNSNTVMTFIANIYSSKANGNVLSSAMSWIYFLIVILIIAAVAGIMSMFVFYQRRD